MNFKHLKSGLCLATFLSVFSAHSEVHLENMYAWRRAKTLPAGQQIFSFQSSYQDISDRFSVDGRVEPLGEQYARGVTWGQLMSADPEARAELTGDMKKMGLSENDLAATASYEVQRQQVGFGFNWAYGLMTDWMIGIEVPMALTTLHVKQNVDVASGLSRAAGQVGRKSILALQGESLRDRIRQVAEQELANSGYDRVPAQRQTFDFGDISLLSQEAILHSYSWIWSLQQLIRFPTAQNPSVSDYLQSSQDQGPVDLGLTSLLDWQRKKWIYGLRGGYVAQLPDSARMRVNTESGLGVDTRVSRNLGDWVWGAVDTEYHLTERWTLSAEYSVLAKSKDRYGGGAFTQADYDQMSEHTDQQLQQSRVGMLYHIGGESSRSGVTHKWVASVDYTYPWVGHNSSESAQASFELMNYF